MWNNFILNFNPTVLDVIRRDSQKSGYLNFEQYRHELKIIGQYIKDDNTSLCRHNFGLNSHPNTIFWEEGCLRLYFYQGNTIQDSLQINIEFWESGNLNVFLYEKNSRILDDISNSNIVCNEANKLYDNGFTDHNGVRNNLFQVKWIGKVYQNSSFPMYSLIVRSTSQRFG